MGLLKEAEDLLQERQVTHGDMEKNLTNIASLWSTYLATNITPEQVSLCMALLKVARTMTGTSNRDDLLDAAGYIGLAEEMRQSQERAREKWKARMMGGE